MPSLDGPWRIVKTTNGGDDWFHADSGLYMQGEGGDPVMNSEPAGPDVQPGLDRFLA